MNRHALAPIALVALAFSPIAHADEAAPVVDAAPVPSPRREVGLRVAAGARVAYVRDGGFDTFADTDALPSFSIDATQTLLRQGRLSLAVGLGWDVGGRGSDLRGLDTSLTMHRFTVPIEGRFVVGKRLYGFVRAAPGAALHLARVKDPSSPDPLASSAWTAVTDLGAGASVRVDGARPRDLQLWLTPEIGYGLSASATLDPRPARSDDAALGSDGETRVRSLATNGVFWRLSFAAAF